MNVHLLSEQLVAVTQKLDELWKLDHLLLLRLLLLLLRLPLPLPLLLLLPLFLLLLWGVALPQNSTPAKGESLAKVQLKIGERPHLTPSPL